LFGPDRAPIITPPGHESRRQEDESAQVDGHDGLSPDRACADSRVDAGAWIAQVIGVIATVFYVFAFFVVLPDDWRGGWLERVGEPGAWLNGLIPRLWVWIGVAKPVWMLRHGTYCVISGIVLPWIILTAVGRGRPRDIGLRRPNAIAWRVLALSVIASIPFLVWMVRSASFAPYYQPQLRQGAAAFLTYYSVNMISEHFLFHGVMLAALRRGIRWPAPAPVSVEPARGWIRPLRWIGLAQPTTGERGVRRITAWLGLPVGCVCGVVVSGLMFGAAHIGKDGREFLLSFPGGMASAYIAYRTNSAVVPFLLHAAAAGAACLMMVLMN
jgi:hypothetical protein